VLPQSFDRALHVAILALFSGEGLEHRFDLIRLDQRIALDLETIDIKTLGLCLGKRKRRCQQQRQRKADAANH
jgi:hypothetical protein